MSQGRKRIGYPHVVSTLALFVALGGTSYAALKLPSNSVGNAQLRKNAVTGAKVKDGSLSLVDLSHSGILRGPVGPQGATGPAGIQGTPGLAGAIGPSDAYHAGGNGDVGLSTQPNVPTAIAELTSLPAGQYVFTGTADLVNGNGGAEIECEIVAQGAKLASTNGAGGTATEFTYILPFATTGVATEPSTFDVSYECSSNTAYSTPPFAENPHLVAIRVGTLHAQ